MEGSRPILSEIQALATKTNFPAPRRACSGYDYNRMNLLIAVLDSAVLTMAGYTLANICSMLLSLFLGVYMTTAKAAFVSDLTAAAPSDNASGKMTE